MRLLDSARTQVEHHVVLRYRLTSDAQRSGLRAPCYEAEALVETNSNLVTLPNAEVNVGYTRQFSCESKGGLHERPTDATLPVPRRHVKAPDVGFVGGFEM